MQNVVHTSDMVEVVRCRDCAEWDRSWRVGDSDIKNVHYCPILDKVTTSDWFCASGEWKDGEPDG